MTAGSKTIPFPSNFSDNLNGYKNYINYNGSNKFYNYTTVDRY
jgi:hypothetical protein